MIEEDEAAVTYVLKLLQNINDVRVLIKDYGLRSPWWGVDRNLPQTVSVYLSPSDIDSVNEDYASKGINWIW